MMKLDLLFSMVLFYRRVSEFDDLPEHTVKYIKIQGISGIICLKKRSKKIEQKPHQTSQSFEYPNHR